MGLKMQFFWENPYIFYEVGAVLLLGIAFFYLINRFEKKLKFNRRGVSKVLKVMVFAFTGLGILQILGIPVSAIIAFGGIGGIAVGFAAKDLLANIFGGMMIFLDRQFQVGDWIRSPDQEIEGVVEEIGWRLTKIQTSDKRPLYIPNSVFSTISLENPSRMSRRKIKARVRLSYQDAPKIPLVLADVEKALRSHPKVDLLSDYYANLVDLGPYGLEVEICAYTKTIEALKFQVVQQEILLSVLQLIRGHGCETCYPLLPKDQFM
jgi:MscS family membrane protein